MLKIGKEITLAYVRNGKWTKPPPMVIEERETNFAFNHVKARDLILSTT